ncbi:MAG TPA: aldolase [Candidatus Methylomirabilis sp.]|nr:aldolase [Candidatus Methylomirabilis sp.]
MSTIALSELVSDLRTLGLVARPTPRLPEGTRPPNEMLDRWARAAALAEPETRQAAIWAIREAAHAVGLIPASIQDLYLARGKGQWSDKTVPAMNLRGWTYQTGRAAFRAARRMGAGLLIFEQALAESVYAAQPPIEFTAAILAAGMREGHSGPIFLQADHDQVSAKSYQKDAQAETQRLSDVIREQIAASFFNIDIDASTVVDLSLPTLVDQQRLNAELTARFTRLVRTLDPMGVTISVGAEIGEVGAHNTTPEELRAFMATYPMALATAGGGAGITKVSVNSGTYHGGKVLPDGSLAKVPVAFDTLRDISRVAREEFGLAGAVQHGASTLPMDYFGKFPESGTVEIHLALGFNNLIFDHPKLPQEVKDEIRSYCFAHHASERKPDQTEAQFIYTTRKKAWAGMKERFWNLPGDIQEALMDSLEEMFRDMFVRMHVGQTAELVAQHTHASVVPVPIPPALATALEV